MEEKLEKILEIKVDVGEAIKGIDSLNAAVAEQKKLQRELQSEIDRLTEAEGDNTDAIAEMREAYILSQQKVKDYNAQIQGMSKSVQNQLKIDREQMGSMQQMRAQLSNLTKAYDSLSAEEREAAKGQELKDKINQVTDALKNSEEATQRYYRNVGNYENAIKNSLGLNSKFANTLNQINQNGIGATLNEMAGGVKNVGKETAKLLLNPIVAFLAAIAAAAMAVAKGIKSSEENTAKWSAVMATFKPILDLVTVGCQKLASAALNALEWLGEGLGSIMKWGERLPGIGKILQRINAESERYKENAKEMYQIDVDRRNLDEEASKSALQVSELRTKAKDKERYTDEQRLKFVQEANEVERKIAKEKVALAERALQAAQEEAQATQNKKEVEEELRQLRINVNNEQKAYFDKTRELLEQENTIKNEIAAKDKARADEAKRLNDEKLAEQEKYNEALKDAMQAAEDMLIELMEEGLKKEKEIERVRFERQIESIKEKQAQYEKESEIYQQFALQIERATQLHNEALIDLEKEYNKSYEEAIEEKEVTDEQYLEHKKRMAELEKKIEDSKLREYSSIAGSISAILDATAGDNIKRIKTAKIAALGEIAINQGIAIAQAVTSVKGLVFPANVPAIAAAVANALAALVPAIQAVNSVKLARGGHVSGPGTSTSDSVPAMLSNGEFVINARATSMFPELLETINNLGLGIAAPARVEAAYQTRQEAMTLDMMIKAFRHLPRPVVSVEEYSRVENRVDTLENLTRL